MIEPKDIARFWALVNRDGPVPEHRPDLGPCWIWMASRKKFGYGRFVIKGRQWIASRVSWEITFGEIPDGRHILHRCDNPPCVRPSHLFLGTDADNNADRDAKGRTVIVRGSESGMAKLDEAMVILIRDDYANGRANIPQLAKMYGVTPALIGRIIVGAIWQHVGGSVRKGYAGGARNAMATLTEDQVREIRRKADAGTPMMALATEYGVKHNTVWRIVKRQTWRGIE